MEVTQIFSREITQRGQRCVLCYTISLKGKTVGYYFGTMVNKMLLWICVDESRHEKLNGMRDGCFENKKKKKRENSVTKLLRYAVLAMVIADWTSTERLNLDYSCIVHTRFS